MTFLVVVRAKGSDSVDLVTQSVATLSCTLRKIRSLWGVRDTAHVLEKLG